MGWLAPAVGHVDRNVPLRNYCAGLLLDGERKSVEPMAARLAPDHVQSMHESLHHFVAVALERYRHVGASAELFSASDAEVGTGDGMDCQRRDKTTAISPVLLSNKTRHWRGRGTRLYTSF